MKYLFAVFSCLIVFGCAGDAGFKFEQLTLEQALEKAHVEKKQVLLDFYSPT